MRVGDLLEMGLCTPSCLLALIPEGSCKCRCDGEHHGIAADLEVEVSEEVDPNSTYSILLPQVRSMAPLDQMKFLERNGWKPELDGWSDPQSPSDRLAPTPAIIRTWRRQADARQAEQREKDRAYRRRKKVEREPVATT